ncbi:MAG: alpha/beta fold hydrolase [Oceanibaculum sp.]
MSDPIQQAGGNVGWLSASDGARLRYATFRQDGAHGCFLVLPGFTEFIEKYLEVVGELAARGYDCVVLDWRGQGKSDPRLADRHKGHVLDFGHFQQDARQLLDEVALPLATGRPLHGLGHSMGGHNLLRLLHDRGGDFRRAVAVAPMIDIWSGFLPPAISRAIACAMVHITPDSYVPNTGPYDPAKKRFEGNQLTGDRARFERTKQFILDDPDLALGGPTWRWLDSAFDSMRLLRRPSYAAAIATPVLIASAGRDRIVRSAAQHDLARHMPACRILDFPEAEHEILLERDAIRLEFWRAFDAFMAEEQE